MCNLGAVRLGVWAMLKKEAKWLSEAIYGMNPYSIFPLLNIGSSTEQFRKEVQPWIDELIFKPARDAGFRVIHSDIKADIGIDAVGNISDPDFLGKLKRMGFRSVLCANLLEHIQDTERVRICTAIESLIPVGGSIFVTCPYKYPYHPDPIDTGFRPTTQELARMFPQCEVKINEIVDCGTQLDRLMASPALLARSFFRTFIPFYKPSIWWRHLCVQLWLFRQFKVSCVVLERK